MTKSTSKTSLARKPKRPAGRRRLLYILLAVVLLALAGGGVWLAISGRERAALQRATQERANTLELARSYM
jgi:uncharacterized protein involved in exopolysaccharide biosynthesis